MARRPPSFMSCDLFATCFAIAGFLLAASMPSYSQTLTTLYTFKGSSDGSFPSGPLLIDQKGNLYGTTMFGGTGRNGRSTANGTVFELSPASGGWSETTLHSFKAGPDGFFPTSGVIADGVGNLYGTTSGGNANGLGTVFQLVPPATSGGAWIHNILYEFHGPDGGGPNGLVMDSAGNLYGTTRGGGTCGWGVVFQLSPPTLKGGAWNQKVLLIFADTNCQTASGGIYPNQIFLGADGALYGTTIAGGAYDLGVVFRLTPPASGQGEWTEQIIYTFTGTNDGGEPYDGVISDAAGNLYGTAYFGGGVCLCGTVFELSPPNTAGGKWTETTLYSFTNGEDGGHPTTGITFDNNGNLYGTTSFSLTGACGCGAVFELQAPTKNGSWSEVTLHHFTNHDNGGLGMSGLTFDGNRAFFGLSGGTEQSWSHGIAFEIAP